MDLLTTSLVVTVCVPMKCSLRFPYQRGTTCPMNGAEDLHFQLLFFFKFINTAKFCIGDAVLRFSRRVALAFTSPASSLLLSHLLLTCAFLRCHAFVFQSVSAAVPTIY